MPPSIYYGFFFFVKILLLLTICSDKTIYANSNKIVINKRNEEFWLYFNNFQTNSYLLLKKSI